MTTTAEPPRSPDPGPVERETVPRPSQDEDPADTFEQRKGTRWLEPRLLLQTAKQVAISGVLGQYNDKRELMGGISPGGYLDLGGAGTRDDDGNLWLDYVSDLGDSFEATYSVAALLSRPTLDLAPQEGEATTTRRGRLLVMGGDECYPAASVDEYENRLIGPYRAALPGKEPDAPFLQAVPGNHDWYDGLTAFMRTFCQRRWIGGWRTRQARSYFATRLSDRWWLWGIDIQFDTYLDEAQLAYFTEIARELQPGDAILLCTAKPSWVAATDEDCEAYATLDFLERTVIRPRGAGVRLALTGDRHHYSRYEAADLAQRITAGGGGAYLSATHHLPTSIQVPPPTSRARSKSPSVRYTQGAVYPTPEDSRRLRWGILRLPFTTPAFAGLLGGIYAVLAVALGAALREPARGLPADLRAVDAALRDAGWARLAGGLADSILALLLGLVVVGGAIAFTQDMGRWRGRTVGLLHGLAHLALAVSVIRLAVTLTAEVLAVPAPWSLALVVLLVFVGGGILAAELVAWYLLLADRARLNVNELFAGQAIPDRRNFLRLRLEPDETLTVFPVGLPRVPRGWERRPDWRAGERERFQPADGQLHPFLIEPPIRIPRTPPATGAATSRTDEAHRMDEAQRMDEAHRMDEALPGGMA
ncbi:metallophosphoesterase [Blastococcus xanthinilyticus]|uniref:Calcineurin-like phosphoesterase family protein n=1 Tax=Blastococcus xanthinilyticus TaxID=1564164 RepID=A0A5S5D2W7_9ACTN|nr:metallophosphoesterase [Blastococcus xanthinilyticus]TYP88979.1 hypothetical protein BD833_103135 [Blastococcus xanthinilyticus]